MKVALIYDVIYPYVKGGAEKRYYEIAKIFNVGRGVDVIIYIALFLIFYLIFKINLRMEKVEQDITKIVKEVALRKRK